MEASPYQSGIFYFKNLAQAGEFPQQLRKTLASRIDPRFTAIFGSLLLFFSVTVAILSSLKVQEDTYNEKEVLKIQERYAQLVLNQPKPKVEPVEKVAKVKSQATVDQGKTEEKKEETAVNRDKESVVQREVRRESTRAEREQKREQVARQVMSSGIFAAITASSGGGSSGGPRVSDLLSADDGLSDISSMNISKGTFATKNESVDPATIGKRKSDRVSNVGIEKQDVGRAAVTQLASTGSVNITSRAPEITGESANMEERSQAAIGRIVTRETQRLKRVYEDWLKRDPQLAGNLTVKFSILPNGSVANVVIVKTTMNNQDFDEAIVRYIKRWQFPEVQGSGPVEVVYPFVFEGQS